MDIVLRAELTYSMEADGQVGAEQFSYLSKDIIRRSSSREAISDRPFKAFLHNTNCVCCFMEPYRTAKS